MTKSSAPVGRADWAAGPWQLMHFVKGNRLTAGYVPCGLLILSSGGFQESALRFQWHWIIFSHPMQHPNNSVSQPISVWPPLESAELNDAFSQGKFLLCSLWFMT